MSAVEKYLAADGREYDIERHDEVVRDMFVRAKGLATPGSLRAVDIQSMVSGIGVKLHTYDMFLGFVPEYLRDAFSYNIDNHVIYIPEKKVSLNVYNRTMLHELAHATVHVGRRRLTNSLHRLFFDNVGAAAEEMVAELVSYALSSDMKLAPHLDRRSENYVFAWSDTIDLVEHGADEFVECINNAVEEAYVILRKFVK